MILVLRKVISGGQTGVDQIGLKVAKDLGYEIGGMASKGWRTEDGPAPWLAEYGLIESDSSQYSVRTIWNVRHSDMTVWFGDVTSPGGKLTERIALSRPDGGWVVNPSAKLLRDFLVAYGTKVLNVAGNRLHTNPEATVQANVVLYEALAR